MAVLSRVVISLKCVQFADVVVIVCMWLSLCVCGVCQGGRHVDYVTDQIITKLLDVVKRKEKKAGVTIKPFQVNLVFLSFFLKGVKIMKITCFLLNVVSSFVVTHCRWV